VRIDGWQRALNVYIIDAQERYKREGFSYAGIHCAPWCADWVQILTGGQDPMAEYRGRYSTQSEAEALLAELDGTLLEALTKRLGQPIHPAHAMRGDIAYKASVGCGIYFTSGARMIALFLGDGGFVDLRADATDHAFAVR
jgi:hypothetical protein